MITKSKIDLPSIDHTNHSSTIVNCITRSPFIIGLVNQSESEVSCSLHEQKQMPHDTIIGPVVCAIITKIWTFPHKIRVPIFALNHQMLVSQALLFQGQSVFSKDCCNCKYVPKFEHDLTTKQRSSAACLTHSCSMTTETQITVMR